MPHDDLTPVQRSVLLILMAEAREVPNAELRKVYRFDLKKDRRDDLVERKWIKVRRQGQLVFLELAERGWRWCSDQDGTQVPAGAGHGGAVAYAMLAGLRRNAHRFGNVTLPELFARYEDTALSVDEAVGPTDVEAQIRKAYQRLAAGAGHWVKLTDLRDVLGALDRSEVDRVLVGMNRTPEVSIVPESNQKVLTDRDRAAAILIGNQDKHLIAIGSS